MPSRTDPTPLSPTLLPRDFNNDRVSSFFPSGKTTVANKEVVPVVTAFAQVCSEKEYLDDVSCAHFYVIWLRFMHLISMFCVLLN